MNLDKKEEMKHKKDQFLNTKIRLLGLIIGIFALGLLLVLLLSFCNVISTFSVICVLVALCVAICTIFYIRLIEPLDMLVKSLLDVDFESDVVDFTDIDNLEAKGGFDTQLLIYKFKYLVDIIAERITKYNSENYKSEHDGLTGCYNRVHLDRIKSRYEHQSSTYVIFIDVNNLKKMNDIYGHEAGDALLKNAAKSLSYWNGYGDVYRMGGDEFMIVLSNKKIDFCQQLLNVWYPTVGVLNRVEDGFKCVLSYGVAYSIGNCNFDELQKTADDNMYDMKVRIKKEFGEEMR